MAVIEISPRGAIEFGRATIDKKRFVMIETTDQISGSPARLYFDQAAFVSFADHIAMVVDAVVSGEFFDL